MNDSLYKTPNSKIDEPVFVEREERKGRRAYVMYMFMIWIVLPLLVSFVFGVFGFGEGALSSIEEAGKSTVRLDIFYAWYLSIPLYIWVTYRRVTDTYLSPWTTLIFVLPILNFVILFWPPKRH